MPWFTTWFCTPYYKLLYGHRDDQEAARWVEALQVHLGLPRGSAVLDVACGRGRHARCFDRAGMKVTGIDLSPEVVEEARRTVPNARFEVHDMREPYVDRQFDLAICLFTSLGYSAERTDDLRSLTTIARALVPGGRFVLDLLNPARARHDLVAEEHLRVGDVEFLVQRGVEGDVFTKRITVRDQGRMHQFIERVHAYAPEEIDLLIGRAGLRITDRTDAPPFAPFDRERSRRMVIWAERPA